jgi:hypothetical protein
MGESKDAPDITKKELKNNLEKETAKLSRILN